MQLRNRIRCIVGVGGALAVAAAYACCGVTAAEEWVRFSGQANIIVWDPESKTEHFVRSAKFATGAKDLGFIAPTPTVPRLTEVDPAAFDTLLALEPKPDLESKSDSPAADAGGVEVVQVREVAGFDAVTLKAGDPKALAQWMKAHGYATSKDVEEWTRFYLEKNWYLTAFKVSSNSGRAETGLVMMSFQTDRPFNPYYVPKSNVPRPDDPQTEGLMLFFVGPGIFDVDEPAADSSFHAGWSAPIPASAGAQLATQLKLAKLPATASVTYFRDYEFPTGRATDDLYFKKIRDSEPPPAEPNLLVPAAAGGVGIAAVILFLRRHRALPARS